MNNPKAEVSFYHLTTHPLEKVLPKILEKAYDGGLRSLVVADSAERMQALNACLWTYSPGSFLPHGMEGDKATDPLDNPIWISLDSVNKNNASVLVLTGGSTADDLSGYVRCIDIFDGNDPASLQAAQSRRAYYQSQNHPVVYWKQSLTGTWEKEEGLNDF